MLVLVLRLDVQLDGGLVLPSLCDLRHFLYQKIQVYVFLGVLIVQVDVLTTDLCDCYLLHVVESFNDLGYFFRAFDDDNGPFVADSRDKSRPRSRLKGRWGRTVDKSHLSINHIDLNIAKSTVNAFQDGHRQQRVQYLHNEGTRLELPEVILVKLLGAEILIKRNRLRVDLTAVPYQLYSMLLSVELIEGNVRNGQGIPHGQFGKCNIVLLLLSEF